ncbi:MAG: ribosome silencing factor [Bacteroidales bacterium]|nr:ribosome silencing factor [Bacteroidales bacterium]
MPITKKKTTTKKTKTAVATKAKRVVKKVVKKTVKKAEIKTLKDSIITAMKNKNADEIVVIDFKKIKNHFCDFFIICSANSGKQIESIADEIEIQSKKNFGVYPKHKEGFENTEWVLLDFIDIVVHIFKAESRAFYNLEQLWADADFDYIKQ